jgi:hypothetical protein
MNNIENEYSQLIKKNFDDIVYNAEYKTDLISSDVKNVIIKHMICKCINSQHKYNLIKTGIKCVCTVCNGTYPLQKIPITSEYTNILNYFNINVTVNNYNNYNELDLFESDIKIENSIFNDDYKTNLINQILSEHKINDISKLLHYKYKDFVYDGDWYYYKDGIWKKDIEELILKSKILDLKDIFIKIHNYYKTNKLQESSIIIKQILSLKIKLGKPSFKEEVVKESKLLYADFTFFNKLNKKKYIIPFLNGLYDLNLKLFRPYTKDDYVSITCNYNYEPECNNTDVINLLKLLFETSNIDHTLKKLSKSLIKYNMNYTLFLCNNDNITIYILLNLIKLTYGNNLFNKIETSSLARKKNLNEFNDKMKYINSYIIHLSDYDNKKINLESLHDIFTDEIYIKTNYKETIVSNINANIYITTDKMIDIKDNFKNIDIIVLNPLKSNIDDMNIINIMNNDISWRQTFMNILLEYYYNNDIKPIDISVNQIRNDYTYMWLENHIILCENNILNLKELCEYYYSNISVHSKLASILRKEVELFLKDKYPEITYNFRDTTFKNKKVRGWIGIGYKG